MIMITKCILKLKNTIKEEIRLCLLINHNDYIIQSNPLNIDMEQEVPHHGKIDTLHSEHDYSIDIKIQEHEIKVETISCPHHCKHCDKGFKLKYDLKRHERIHTEESAENLKMQSVILKT